MLTSEQFDRVRKLALSLAGIELAERHRELLGRRSQRLGICDSAGFGLLLEAVERGEASARQKLWCLLTTKFTGFFRHPEQFELAVEHALRAAKCRGRARLWSAGVATGEEAYSLAIALIERAGCEHPPVSILGTDIDTDALATAQRGEYGEAALSPLEPARRERFFLPAGGPRCWAILPAARRLVEFRPLNLISETQLVDGPFDVIFCRNVLMYLETRCRYRVLESMASLLAPDGLLMIDPTEHLGKAGHLFVPEAEAVFRRRDSSSKSHKGIDL